MYVCRIDEIQLYVICLFLKKRSYLCAFMLCFWGLHASFFGSTCKHTAQKMYKPWIYERGRAERRRGHGAERPPTRSGRHMANRSAPQTCSALTRCTSLSFFSDYDTTPASVSLWSTVCHHVSRSWEMSCIKITNTKYRKKYSPGV